MKPYFDAAEQCRSAFHPGGPEAEDGRDEKGPDRTERERNQRWKRPRGGAEVAGTASSAGWVAMAAIIGDSNVRRKRSG